MGVDKGVVYDHGPQKENKSSVLCFLTGCFIEEAGIYVEVVKRTGEMARWLKALSLQRPGK